MQAFQLLNLQAEDSEDDAKAEDVCYAHSKTQYNAQNSRPVLNRQQLRRMIRIDRLIQDEASRLYPILDRSISRVRASCDSCV